ncbi:MAG: hypothetical protein KBG72_14740 [Agrobacterium sp.]|uniref:hypothetical protein n=1 Tax=Agrobacterium tomkonis TaxID=1183410 RepID=UPI001B624ABF|nr:hypothetical protein [Agrobacterium sp.]MCA1879222.1 hypothetical protein [Agrobacterium tumefaciens]
MKISGQLADTHMCARQNRQADKADGRDFQKLQNNTQNINPRHSSDGGEMALQTGKNKSATGQTGSRLAGNRLMARTDPLHRKGFHAAARQR